MPSRDTSIAQWKRRLVFKPLADISDAVLRDKLGPRIEVGC